MIRTRDEEIKALHAKITKLENEQKAEDLIVSKSELFVYLKDLLVLVNKWGVTDVDIKYKRGPLSRYCGVRSCTGCPMEEMCDDVLQDTLEDMTPEKLKKAINKLEKELQ